MMRVKARRQPEEAELIIIPMIDVMMFLLMFFIVASLALAVQNGLPVSLPKASTAEKHQAQNVTITLTPDGQLHVNTKSVPSPEAITEELQGLHITDKTLIIINADMHSQYGQVTSVMDACRKAGGATFAFATK